jgi:hypothetical protein
MLTTQFNYELVLKYYCLTFTIWSVIVICVDFSLNLMLIFTDLEIILLKALEVSLASEQVDISEMDFSQYFFKISFLFSWQLPYQLLLLLSLLFLFYIPAIIFLFFFESGLLKFYQFLNSIHRYYYF